ncbi:MAG: hypothetical protein JWN13_1790 [Betaproteobacteria bacterium]|nr:hypothetical protein [Betaproteobacteria bacterium]
MPDFWASCGYRLLERGDDGRLIVTDDYLRMYFKRPELAPVAESCPDELVLHERLLNQPRCDVSEDELNAIADEVTRENYRIILRFRQQLLAWPTVEACYMNVFRGEVAVPPAFIHDTAQVILRGILDGAENGLEIRAAEMFFRPQSVSTERGAVMLADQETVQRYASHSELGNVGRLLIELQAPLKTADLEVLDEPNHAEYFARDERYDLVLNATPNGAGAMAFARVLERWIEHFHGVRVSISSVREIPEDEWVWHVGLDAEATAMLNDIYNGADVEEDRLKRVIGLFRLEFSEPTAVRPELAGAPVFLGLAMTAQSILRMKPQNLLMNLPLARHT